MKIRIAVAVAKDGRWSCDDSEDDAIEFLPPDVGPGDFHLVWVEADVPLPPEPPVVKGTVVP